MTYDDEESCAITSGGTYTLTYPGYTTTAAGWHRVTNYDSDYWTVRIPVSAPQPDRKRRIPFYRALFIQTFPEPAQPRKRAVSRWHWWPLMAPRVRIDRSQRK